ncbi:MAG: transposase [Methylovulum sp.]
MQENQSLSQIVRLLKGRSAHIINHHLQRQGSIWDRAFHDHALRKDEEIKNIARYIVANPLRAKLVEKLDDYPLWDAVWL